MTDNNGASLIGEMAQTVREFESPDVIQSPVYYLQRGPLLPAWGTQAREVKLWEYDHHNMATIWQGASRGIAKRIASTPYIVEGPQEEIGYWQNFFMSADFAQGYTSFVETYTGNFLRHDIGGIMEVIGAGAPDSVLVGEVKGIANLDSRYCYPTGNPVYPFYYYDPIAGAYHKMHYSRVRQIVDSPDGDPRRPNTGLCALSRAISILDKEVLINYYIHAQLDDKPMPGLVSVSGISEEQFSRKQQQFVASLSRDDLDIFGRVMFLFGLRPESAAKFDTMSFSKTPDNWDYRTYIEVLVSQYAAVLGVSQTEFWQLTVSGLGAGTQSQILAEQAEGKTIGYLRASLERVFNSILPPEYTFRFEYEDTEKDMERAQAAQVWVSIAQSLAVTGELNTEERRRLLADRVDAIREIVTDPDGTMRTRDDVDLVPEDDAVAGDADVVTDVAPMLSAVQPQDNNLAPIATQEQSVQEELPDNIEATNPLNGAQIQAVELLVALGIARGLAERMVSDSLSTQAKRSLFSFKTKEWSKTRNDFIGKMATIFERDNTGVRAGVRLRSSVQNLLRSLGQQAYLDGANEAGANAKKFADLGQTAQERLRVWIAEQSEYISKLVNASLEERRGLPGEQAKTRAQLWADMSLRDIYMQAKLGANDERLLMWSLGATEEHCDTCLALHMQVHRAVDWKMSGFRPGSRVLLCNGFNCDCKLDNAPEGSEVRGSLEGVPSNR